MSTIPVAGGLPLSQSFTAAIATATSMFWISALAGWDMLGRRLPDAFVVLVLLPTAMAAAILTLQGSTTAITGVGFGAAVWAAPFLVVHLAAPAHLEFGDVKAAGAIGGALGLTQSTFLIATALVLALAVGVAAALGRHRRDLALGPCLFGAAAACLAAGSVAGGAP